MRTTVNLDEDVLLAVKALAKAKRVSLGRALSILVRRALSPGDPGGRMINGVPVFQRPEGAANPVTIDLVNDLRDGDGIEDIPS